MFINFKRDLSVHPQPDLAERIGMRSLNVCCSPFGEIFRVTKYEDVRGSEGLRFKEEKTKEKVKKIALAIFLFPITLITALIGKLALSFSASYRKMNKDYLKSIQSEDQAARPQVSQRQPQSPKAQSQDRESELQSLKLQSQDRESELQSPRPQPHVREGESQSPRPQPHVRESEPSGLRSEPQVRESEPQRQRTSPKVRREEPLHCKYARSRIIDYRSDEGRKLMGSILEELWKEEPSKSVLRIMVYHHGLNKDREKYFAYFADKLSEGTCFGQTMLILNLLNRSDPQKITEKYLHDRLDPKVYIKYQLIHHLSVFLHNLGDSVARGYGIPYRLACKGALDKQFPFQKHPDAQEIQIPGFSKLPESEIRKLLGSFIRDDCQSSDHHKNFAFEIVLTGNKSAHSIVSYYNGQAGKYFWYDVYSERDGLLSTSDFLGFLGGASHRLRNYQASYHTLKLTAYRLST